MSHQESIPVYANPGRETTFDGNQMTGTAAFAYRIQMHLILFIIGGQWARIILDNATPPYYTPMVVSAVLALRLSKFTHLLHSYNTPLSWHLNVESSVVRPRLYKLGFLLPPALTFVFSSALTTANCAIAIASQRMSVYEVGAIVFILCITYGVVFMLCVSTIVICMPLEGHPSGSPFAYGEAIQWHFLSVASFHFPIIFALVIYKS